MEWQAIGVAVQILMIATGWVLFQRARGELSARAAETPVLGEVKALQIDIKQLLGVLEATADKESTRIESACTDAAVILNQLETKLRDAEVLLCQYTHLLTAGAPGPSGVAPYRLGDLVDGSPRFSEDDSDAAATQENLRKMFEARQSSANGPGSALSGGQIAAARRDMVFNMADNGESPAAIAGAARLSEGEVETLLGLRVSR